MSRSRANFAKFTAFAAMMSVLTALLFMVFAQVQAGPHHSFSAVFADVSQLSPGDSVRAAGLRVGTVTSVDLADDHVTVAFDIDQDVHLTTGTRAVVRYLNLVGDRYLALVDGPGSTHLLPAGSVIPADRTAPALDIDLLLTGLKPVLHSLNPQDVNALTGSLLAILQGNEDTLSSLLSGTSSFSASLADNSQVVEQLIDNLKETLGTLSADKGRFDITVDRLDHFIAGLASDRDAIGSAIEALATGTASITDLLQQARPPLAGTIDHLATLASNLDVDKDRLDTALQKAPENYRKLVRVGSYGNFLNYYLCDMNIRLNDPSGKVLVLPWIHQDYGRCRG